MDALIDVVDLRAQTFQRIRRTCLQQVAGRIRRFL
jgi:hypothetical protein